MAERGNTTHRPELDEQLAHEAQSIVQGHGSNSHVEEFRQSEPVPDDTDDAETLRASGYDGEVEGELQDDSTDVLPEDDADVVTDTDGRGAIGGGAVAGDSVGGDDTVFTTETGEETENEVVDGGTDDA
jgi:hypothetical protein